MTRPAFSVFRARFVEPADTLVGVDADKRTSYYVAKLLVRDLRRLGLTVIPEPDPEGPAGHLVIPELSWKAYQANKRGLQEIQLELGRLASEGIVLRPSESHMFPEPSHPLGTSIVTPYKNLSGDSGIATYEIGADFIKVGFRDGRPLYLYTYQSAGRNIIEQMKVLAKAGQGLGTFISTTVRNAYAAKLRG
jgi:hypothetical protein